MSVTVRPSSYLTATQFYNATTPGGELVYRKAVERAVTLCYTLQRMPKDQTVKCLADREWLKEKMGSPKIWTAVRGHTYTTGIPEFNLLNEKPCIVAYSPSSVLHTPLLLVAFPGMEFTAIADLATAIKVIMEEKLQIKSSNFGEVGAGKGFVEASMMAVKSGLFQVMQGLLQEYHRPSQMVQTVFSGHSLGGAVASLCALMYVDRCLSSKNRDNQVIVFTIGQPKTIKDLSTSVYDDAVGTGQYLRLIAIDTQCLTDCVTGFVDSRVDTFGCAHAGTELKLQTGKTLTKTVSGVERLQLHPSSVYWKAMEARPDTPFVLTDPTQKTTPDGRNDQLNVSALENRLAALEKQVGDVQRTIQQLHQKCDVDSRAIPELESKIQGWLDVHRGQIAGLEKLTGSDLTEKFVSIDRRLQTFVPESKISEQIQSALGTFENRFHQTIKPTLLTEITRQMQEALGVHRGKIAALERLTGSDLTEKFVSIDRRLQTFVPESKILEQIQSALATFENRFHQTIKPTLLTEITRQMDDLERKLRQQLDQLRKTPSATTQPTSPPTSSSDLLEGRKAQLVEYQRRYASISKEIDSFDSEKKWHRDCRGDRCGECLRIRFSNPARQELWKKRAELQEVIRVEEMAIRLGQ